MKRKGFIFMEVLLALLLLSALAAAVFPILGQTAGAMAFMDRRRRAVNEAVFAADFMIEKIRNNLRESAAQMSGNVYRYEAYIWVKDGKGKKKKVRAPYSFFVEGEKLKVRLHNGMSEPVTGENTGGHGNDGVPPAGRRIRISSAAERAGERIFPDGKPESERSICCENGDPSLS